MQKFIIVKILFSCLLVTTILSCDSNRVFENHVEIPSQSWNVEQTIQFQPQIDDTTNIHNIFVSIRNTPNYTFSNIFLFVKITSPSGSWIRDTLEIPLADEHGNWLGKGISNVFYSRSLFKSAVRFPEAGLYGFEIVQGMRRGDLEGIRDVGLRIERIDQ